MGYFSWEDQNRDQPQETRPEKKESDKMDASSQQSKKKEGEKPVKRVSIFEITETLDV